MDPKGRALGTLLFHLLIVLGTCVLIAMETKAHPTSHNMMNQINPNSTYFFFIQDIKLGKKMATVTVDDLNLNPLSSPYLLRTKKEADAIPFSSKQLPYILHHFSILKGSPKAEGMENTLRYCESMPPPGEKKFCATSYESWVDLGREIFGFKTDVQVFSTKILDSRRSTYVGEVREYTIVQILEKIAAPRTATCHPMRYPYEVIYCHSQDGGTRLHRVLLQDENGGKVEALAVCHMDTSLWSPEHKSLKELGIKPGAAPVCHFLPTSSFAMVPSTATTI